MHASCSRPAEDDGGGAVEADPLELCVAVLAVGRHLAHADLVRDHLDRLLAVDHAAEIKGIGVKSVKGKIVMRSSDYH